MIKKGLTLKKLPRKILFSFIILLILLFCGISWLFIEPKILTVKKYTLKYNDLPSSFNGYKIAFIADIHAGDFYSLEQLKKLIEKTKKLNPDLVILGGDYVYNYQGNIDDIMKPLAGINAPDGIIGVAGNHDHMDSIDPITASMRKNNIAVINNSKKTIAKDGDIISILGVDDIWFVEPKTEKVLSNIKPENFTILVSHNPDFFIGNSFDKKIDLGLSGHTHGGQVTFFGLFAPYVPIESSHKYRTGLFHEPEMDLIVSNGIGTVMLPIRFFAPPQIVLIELNN